MIIPKDGNVAWHRTERGRGQGRVGERISRTGTRFCAAKAHRREPPVAPRRKAPYPHSASIPKPGMVLLLSPYLCDRAHPLLAFRYGAYGGKQETGKNTTGMWSSIRSSSSVGFRLPSGIAIGSLKSMNEPGDPLSRPRHLPNGYSFPGRGIL